MTRNDDNSQVSEFSVYCLLKSKLLSICYEESSEKVNEGEILDTTPVCPVNTHDL